MRAKKLIQVVVVSVEQVVEVLGGVVGMEVAGSQAGGHVKMAMPDEQVVEVVGMQEVRQVATTLGRAARPCRSTLGRAARPCRSSSGSRSTVFGKWLVARTSGKTSILGGRSHCSKRCAMA